MKVFNINKNISSFMLLAVLCLIGLGSFFTACNDDDDDTITEVKLLSYGPMPIARGAELRFIGTNLQKVNSILIPDGIEITKDNFEEQTPTGIKVIVPQEAIEGYVQLVTDEETITTKTALGFDEPILIESFSPTNIKPGSVITIQGDYLNLVGEVIFNERAGVDSSEFITKSRKQITLVVPVEAQSGKFSISNSAEDPIIITTESELQVVIPTLTSIGSNPIKPGTTLAIAGTSLDLVTSISFGGEVKVTEFTGENGTSIQLTVPMNAQDGKVNLNLASGLVVSSDEDLVMVVPTVSISPTSIKNGASLSVTGENLDLISNVTFGGGVDGVIQDGGSSTAISVTVPDAAITGEVVFTTTSAKTVSGGELSIVTPTVSSFNPISAKPNSDVVFSGTDLDVVSKVVFSGNIEGNIVNQSETEITVTVPVGAETGYIMLVAINGVEIYSPSELEVLQNLPDFTSYSEGRAEPGKILTLNGTKMDLIKELIFPEGITATAYGLKSDTQIEVYVPEGVTSGYGTIKLITYEGEEGLLPEVYFGSTDPVVNESYVFFDFNNTGAKDSWWGNAIGSGILDDPDNSVDGSSFWNIDGMSGTGWWDGLFFRNGSNNFVTDGLDATTDVYKFDVNVREAIYEGSMRFRLGNASNDGGDGYWYSWAPWNGLSDGYKTEGWVTVEIPLSEFKDASGNSIPDAALGGSEFGWIWSWGTSIKINMGIDNIRFEKK